MKKTYLILMFSFVICINKLNAQNVTIPDVNFKTVLLANTSINTNSDTEIQVTEATNCTFLYVPFNNIADLTGIEAFTTLSSLFCGSNQLTSLNVSSNTALTALDCEKNQLTSLNVSANTALTFLKCGTNLLTSLNLSTNTAITYLDCNANQLTDMNVSANASLNFLNCDANQLTSLNVQNGNNANIPTYNFNALNNPNLTCIQVDNIIYSDTAWGSKKDPTANFSSNCGSTGINELTSNEINVYPNPTNGNFTIANVEKQSQLIILNALSETIYSEKINGDKTEFDLSKLPSGIYFVRVINKKDYPVSVVKFISKSKTIEQVNL
jgi:hypothetical protein